MDIKQIHCRHQAFQPIILKPYADINNPEERLRSEMFFCSLSFVNAFPSTTLDTKTSIPLFLTIHAGSEDIDISHVWEIDD